VKVDQPAASSKGYEGLGFPTLSLETLMSKAAWYPPESPKHAELDKAVTTCDV
jgi:Iap family predicted aminopeptidase